MSAKFQGAWFAEIVIFLRNGGERMRAIKLAHVALGVPIREAAAWVDSVRWVRTPAPLSAEARRVREEYPTDDLPEADAVERGPSHWPASIPAPSAAAPMGVEHGRDARATL